MRAHLFDLFRAIVIAVTCGVPSVPGDERTPGPGQDQGSALGTALINRLVAGDTKRARELISRGADVNDPGLSGCPPLYWAAESPSEDMVGIADLLISRGAKVNPPCRNGFTPLHAACTTGTPKMVEFLLSHGADVSAREDVHGATPLHATAGTGVLLKRYDSELKKTVEYESNPGRAKVIDLLLGHDAKVNSLDKRAKTPLDLAREHGRHDLETVIARHGGLPSNALGSDRAPGSGDDATTQPAAEPPRGK